MIRPQLEDVMPKHPVLIGFASSRASSLLQASMLTTCTSTERQESERGTRHTTAGRTWVQNHCKLMPALPNSMHA